MGRGINNGARKIYTEMTFKKRPKGLGYPGLENSRHVQRPWGRSMSGVCEEQPGDQ